MISRKLFGPPGTGKTTKLLKYVKTFLKLGTPIDKIGYFAFTTKAANEAVDRMLDYHTAFERKDLKHFRTLHSLAFNQLGMKKTQVMQDEHYEDIGKKLGIEVTVYSNGEESTGFINSDSEYFNLINAARIKNISIEYLHLTKSQKINLISFLAKKGYSYNGYGFDHNNFDYLFVKKKNFWNIFLSRALPYISAKHYKILNFFLVR